MPPRPAVDKVLKIEFTGIYASSRWANIMHAAYAGSAPSVADLNGMASDLADLYELQFLSLVSETVDLTEIKVTDLTSDTAAVGLWTGSKLGTGTGTPLPANVALVVSWAIARRYRGGHPRTYFIGQETADQADVNTWKDAHAADYNTSAGTFLDGVNGMAVGATSPLVLGSVSYVTGGDPRVTPIFDPFIGHFVHPRIDSQRRRLGKERT
jgi:hypothetical protein